MLVTNGWTILKGSKGERLYLRSFKTKEYNIVTIVAEKFSIFPLSIQKYDLANYPLDVNGWTNVYNHEIATFTDYTFEKLLAFLNAEDVELVRDYISEEFGI